MESTTRLIRQAHAFRSAMIDWYDRSARDLPWRREPSLYKTVVSEFMLQQTQVKTATPYFHAWLRAFPDFAALASATEEQVLKRWEGLGYYTRARNLLRLAGEIAPLEAAGRIPRDAASWLRFPGVGPYAAAAICSIAFNDASAVVDGNVVRILARLTADETPYKNSSEAAKAYRPLAEALLNARRAGDHNQAMMELGAVVCQKRAPQCLLCPVQSLCQGRARGIESGLPMLDKTVIEAQLVHRAWIRAGDRILLHRIPSASKRMKGLHELPELGQLGIAAEQGQEPILERQRSITRYRITEQIFQLEPGPLADGAVPADCVWANRAELETLPFSGPHRRWIEELLAL